MRNSFDVCQYFESARCRSCELMPLGNDSAYDKERRFLRQIRDAFQYEFAADPIFTLQQKFNSRTRVKLTVTGTADEPVIGLLDQQFTGVELLDCPLHLPRLNELLHFLKQLIQKELLHPYRVAERSGELKGLMLLSNRHGSEVILRFILRSRSLEKRISRLVSSITDAFSEVKVVSINLQPVAHAIFEGTEEIVLTERKKINEQYGGKNFVIAPQSFTQVTPEIAEELYKRAAIFAGNARNFLDLFCGIGGFSLFLGPNAESGTGVELSPQAIECAREAAELNDCSNLRFEVADVLEYLKHYSGPPPELVVVNPPRRGLSEQIIAEILKLGPGRIIYSSCNPDTLIRDLKILGGNYQISRIAPFDMFPLTDHLEVLVSLRKISL